MNKINSTGKPGELSGSIQHHDAQTRLLIPHNTPQRGAQDTNLSPEKKLEKKQASVNSKVTHQEQQKKIQNDQKKGMWEKTKAAELPDWPAREEKSKQTSEKQEIATTAAITGSCCNNNNNHDAGTAAGARGIMGKKKKTTTKCSNAAAAAARRANEAAATTIEREHHSLHHLKIITSTTN